MKKIYFIALLGTLFFCACGDMDNKDNKVFSINDSYEVALGDTLFIPVTNGSGNVQVDENSGSIQASYTKKEDVKDRYGLISVIGKELGTTTLTATDQNTEETSVVNIKVTHPYLRIAFEEILGEWGLTDSNSLFVLVANKNHDCYVLDFDHLRNRYVDTPLYVGNYELSENDETILTFHLKGNRQDMRGNPEEMNKTLRIDSDPTGLFAKLSQGIEKEPQSQTRIKITDLELDMTTDHIVLSYKEGSIPMNIVE